MEKKIQNNKNVVIRKKKCLMITGFKNGAWTLWRGKFGCVNCFICVKLLLSSSLLACKARLILSHCLCEHGFQWCVVSFNRVLANLPISNILQHGANPLKPVSLNFHTVYSVNSPVLTSTKYFLFSSTIFWEITLLFWKLH